jgi:hypothetical protein
VPVSFLGRTLLRGVIELIMAGLSSEGERVMIVA